MSGCAASKPWIAGSGPWADTECSVLHHRLEKWRLTAILALRRLVRNLLWFFDAFVSLSVRSEAAFNQAHPDDPRVFYQSWAGVSAIAGIQSAADDAACEHKRYGDRRVSGITHGAMAPMAAVLGFLPQDAMVTVESAKHGTFRGCFPADHLEEVGDRFSDGVNFFTGFDRVRFYRTVAFELAERGH